MLTPVFHPNFDDTTVCIGDFWAASEGLDDLVIRVGRMITYQEYNIKSPLNGLAAKWAAQNANLLPIDPRVIAPPGQNTAKEKFIRSSERSLKLAARIKPQKLQSPTQPTVSSSVESPIDPWEQKIVING